MLGHSSIVLSVDPYISVLSEVAREAAEAITTLIIEAGCLGDQLDHPAGVPGGDRAGHRRQRKHPAVAV